eukprot:scaffold14984_cov52-Attheya_sp.AAC.2
MLWGGWKTAAAVGLLFSSSTTHARDDFKLTFNDDGPTHNLTQYSLQFFKTEGILEKDTMQCALDAIETFLLAELKHKYMMEYVVLSVELVDLEQKEVERSIPDRQLAQQVERRGLRSRKRYVDQNIYDAASQDETEARRRAGVVSGTEVIIETRVEFDFLPGPSQEEVEEAVKSIFLNEDLHKPLLSKITMCNGLGDLDSIYRLVDTLMPTISPTSVPTISPTSVPTISPTSVPTISPTSVPTISPTSVPTISPTSVPTTSPTSVPTSSPTPVPTSSPTSVPTTSPALVTSSPTVPSDSSLLISSAAPSTANDATQAGTSGSDSNSNFGQAQTANESDDGQSTWTVTVVPAFLAAAFVGVMILFVRMRRRRGEEEDEEEDSEDVKVQMNNLSYLDYESDMESFERSISTTTTPHPRNASVNTSFPSSYSESTSGEFITQDTSTSALNVTGKSYVSEESFVDEDSSLFEVSLQSPLAANPGSSGRESCFPPVGPAGRKAADPPGDNLTRSSSTNRDTPRASTPASSTYTPSAASLNSTNSNSKYATPKNSYEQSVGVLSAASMLAFELQHPWKSGNQEEVSKAENASTAPKETTTKPQKFVFEGSEASIDSATETPLKKNSGNSQGKKPIIKVVPVLEPSGAFPTIQQTASYGTGDGSSSYVTAKSVPYSLDWSDKSKSDQSEANSPLSADAGPSPSDREGMVVWSQFRENERRKKLGLTPLSMASPNLSTPASANTMGGSSFSHSAFSNTDRSERSSASSHEATFINDLVWLENKIADVKLRSAAAGEAAMSPRMSDNSMETDSLSSPAPILSPSTVGEDTVGGYTVESGSSKGTLMQNIVCRDCIAPPGELQIVIQSTIDGPSIHSVKPGSSLEGHLHAGNLIIAVDNVDTRSYSADQVVKVLNAKQESERKITVLHFEN